MTGDNPRALSRLAFPSANALRCGRVLRLPFELGLALRYLRPKKNFVSVITLLCVAGVALGGLRTSASWGSVAAPRAARGRFGGRWVFSSRPLCLDRTRSVTGRGDASCTVVEEDLWPARVGGVASKEGGS